MKATVKLDVTPQEFFDSLAASVAYDAGEARGRHVGVDKLREGFSYRKSLTAKTGAERRVVTRITAWVPARRYAASITAGADVNTIAYELEPAGDGVAITYEEGFSSQKAMSELNGKLVGAIYGLAAKRRVKQRFRQMEAYIKAHRGAASAPSAAAPSTTSPSTPTL